MTTAIQTATDFQDLFTDDYISNIDKMIASILQETARLSQLVAKSAARRNAVETRNKLPVQGYGFAEIEKIMYQFIHSVYFLCHIIEKFNQLVLIFDVLCQDPFFNMPY